MNGLESLAEREAKFHELRQDYRRQLHKLQGAVDQYKLIELERGMDVLLHRAAELAREPLIRHMVAAAATKLQPPPAQSLREKLAQSLAKVVADDAIAKAVADEREACAKLAETSRGYPTAQSQAIRARATKEPTHD